MVFNNIFSKTIILEGVNMINLLDSSNNEINRSITINDADGNPVVAVQLFCRVETGKQISYNMTGWKPVAYEENKAEIQVMVDQFKADCQELATKYGVPII